MASTILFIIMIVMVCILLLTASISSVIGAVNSSKSANLSVNVQNGHRMLVIASILGFVTLTILVVILLVVAVEGGFSLTEVSETLLAKTNPTKDDLIRAYKGEKKLSGVHTTQIILLVVLVLVTILTLVVGILSIIAAVQFAGVQNRDSYLKTAYITAIISSVCCVGGIGLIIVAIIAYLGIKNLRDKQLKEAQTFVKKTEEELGVTEEQLEIVTKTITKTKEKPIPSQV